jgi:hypothetical protein
VFVGEKNRGLEMQPGTWIYGTFFGGGWEGASIYFAQGWLSGSTLTISGVDRCEDDLVLCEMIRVLRGPWGLDFPFACLWIYTSRYRFATGEHCWTS